MTKDSFRHDINALRALAVVLVALYHFGLKPLEGGFIGVDIFFVISGFLMTQIISRRCDRGDFSIIGFYGDRARRIMPALIALCAILLAYGWMTFLPSNYVTLSEHTLSALTCVSNLTFWHESGYFDQSALSKWLLHTWSLSVEWQFYAGYPIVLWLMYRFKKAKLIPSVIAAGAIVSLALSWYFSGRMPSAAFFLFPTRAWELLLGGVAYYVGTPRRYGAWFHAFGWIGIMSSLAFVHEKANWPGIQAVIPTIGTALVIWSNRGNYRIFRLPIIGWLGKVSYSLYLWHWPVVAFLFRKNLLQDRTSLALGLVGACVFSAASYKFVEEPFRHRLRFGNSDYTRIVSLGAWMLVLGLAALLKLQAGVPGRFPAEVLRYERYSHYDESPMFRTGTCFLSSKADDYSLFNKEVCIGSQGAAASILLFGDSHAANYQQAIAHVFPEYKLYQATASGCRPTSPDQGSRRCVDLMQYMFDEVLPKRKFDYIIVSARWKLADAPLVKHLVERLKGSADNVILLGPTNEYLKPLPNLLGEAALSGSDHVPSVWSNHKIEQIDSLLADALSGPGKRYFSVRNVFCSSGRSECRTLIGDIPTHFDTDHLTQEGAEFVISELARQGLVRRHTERTLRTPDETPAGAPDARSRAE